MAKRPVDIRRLRPTQLLRLLNGTTLGPVMTRSQLRRQMDAAALRVGDGETVHLVRYTRWLVPEYLPPFLRARARPTWTPPPKVQQRSASASAQVREEVRKQPKKRPESAQAILAALTNEIPC